jgi:dUTP pyrophosphatase
MLGVNKLLKEVKIKLLTDTAKVPTCNNNSSGYDLYADEDISLPAAKVEVNHVEKCSLLPGDKINWVVTGAETQFNFISPGRAMVKTGISMQFPLNYVAQIWDRSGMGVKGIHRFAGVGDGNYTGEYKVVLVNFTSEEYKINKGDRIAQVLFVPVEHPAFTIVNALEETERGGKGFNSSGN